MPKIGFREFLQNSKESFGGWWAIMSGSFSIPLGALAILNAWSQRRTFGILALCSAWFAMYVMAQKNYRLLKQLAPRLAIEGVESEVESDAVRHVLVRNCSETVTADNVEIQLMAVQYAYRASGHHPLPKHLLPEKADATSIDPSNTLKFGLLTARYDKDWQTQTPGALPQKRYPVWARTTTPGDVHQGVYTGFETNTKYRIKVKATARNFAPAIQEFDMEFSTALSVCRFKLAEFPRNLLAE